MAKDQVQHVSASLDVCIFVTILWLITIPLYAYGLSKWREFESHFLISKLFPNIIYCLAAIINTRHLISTVLSWVHYSGIEHDSLSAIGWRLMETLDFLSLCFVLYRTLLVLLRFRRQKQQSKPNIGKDHGARYHVCFCVLAIMGSACILISDTFPAAAYGAWSSIAIAGFVVVGVCKYQKVAEGLGIEIVTQTSLVTMVIMFCMYQVETYQHSALLTHIMRYLHELSAFVWCLFPLYRTLRNVQHSQGTLNSHKVRTHKRQASLLDDPYASPNPSSLCSSDGTKLELSLLDQPLYLFLEVEQNHRVFSAYMRHCFAIENLLFIERVSIFKESLLALRHAPRARPSMLTIAEFEEASARDPELPHDSAPRKIPRIQLAFLTSVYAEMQTLFAIGRESGHEMEEVRGGFESHRAGLHAAASMISEYFVRFGSKAEVNLPFAMRWALLQRLADADSFKDYGDYEELFDKAFFEIFLLTMSVYAYHFKQWCC